MWSDTYSLRHIRVFYIVRSYGFCCRPKVSDRLGMSLAGNSLEQCVELSRPQKIYIMPLLTIFLSDMPTKWRGMRMLRTETIFDCYSTPLSFRKLSAYEAHAVTCSISDKSSNHNRFSLAWWRVI